uniref:Transferrin receptor protein 1 n=1 Tax=Hucho hucho TaxID=62062 RepID=A0A4W5K025_9TELE
MGTSVLVEVARAISDMVKNDGFKPRRSIVFASWSAGEYGSVGATKWFEVNTDSKMNLYDSIAGANWEGGVLEPMRLNDPAYSFVTLTGISSVSFRFTTAVSL